ncbi:aa3 type cytochrome c oxidase subunit IV [Devosia crocina]|uniref:Aa3 type cytochrome c oxidase subunit IV n=1 Tax=Devosia crocina TaxID=429728 RepID=A0A1I7MWY2_9HYPH|nr:aa3 type cytochrome c oxidase subunit IV [Devosia crocina]
MATHRPEHHSEPVLESGMDYAEHEKTYNGFLIGVKWSVIGTAALLIILYFVVQP